MYSDLDDNLMSSEWRHISVFKLIDPAHETSKDLDVEVQMNLNLLKIGTYCFDLQSALQHAICLVYGAS